MGADIYLMSAYEKCRDKWQPEFDAAVQSRNSYRGADEKIKAALQQRVSDAYEAMYAEGYFRDSYNATSLFWLLGLSWWQDVPMLKKRPGYLGVKAAKELLQKLENGLQVNDERFAAWCDKHGPKAKHDWDRIDFSKPDNDKAGWRKMFEEKHADLCKLLRKSIELKEPLRCSV
jgi:hypothetical protein